MQIDERLEGNSFNPGDFRNQVAQLIVERALIEDKVTLKGGSETNYYFDMRRLLFDGQSAEVLGEFMENNLRELNIRYDIVGGLELGAVPMAIAIAGSGRSFAIRSEAKSHGLGGRIAGPLRAEDRILLVDDVSTTGQSLVEPARFLKSQGYQIIASAALIDRSQNATKALLADLDIPFFAIFADSELLELAKKNKRQ